MKKILTLVSAAVVAFSAYAQPKIVTPAESHSITAYSVTSKFGEYFRTIDAKTSKGFENGKLIAFISSDAKDNEIQKLTYSYNTSGKLKSISTSIAGGTEFVSEEYEYNKDGSLKSISFLGTKGNLNMKYIYKNEGSKITENIYDQNGKLIACNITVNNAAGNPETIKNYTASGSIAYTTKFTYTESGKLSVVECIYEIKNVEDAVINPTKTIYRYDSDDNLTEIQSYVSNELVAREIYKNDAKGRPVRISYYKVAQKFDTTVNELDYICDIAYDAK
jgi:hypothetical protein